MKFNKWTLGIAAFVAIVGINASPPASALERDVGAVAAITEVQMDANPATLTLEGLALDAIAGAILANQENRQRTAISEVATISAASGENYATWTTPANISAQETLVHSPAATVLSQQIAATKSHVSYQEGGVASGAWLA